MQLFVTSHDPAKCAQDLDDKRIIKMILETSQIISSGLYVRFLSFDMEREAKTFRNQLEDRCKIYNIPPNKHNNWLPCAPIAYRKQIGKWAAKEKNYIWLRAYLENLLAEYQRRFDKFHAYRRHSYFYNDTLFPSQANYCFPIRGDEGWVDYTPYKTDKVSIFDKYRRFLFFKWNNTDKRKPTWRINGAPDWYLYPTPYIAGANNATI